MDSLRSAAELRARGEDFFNRLAGLRPKDQPARFPDALRKAKDLLEAQASLLGHVYLVSDFRAREWADERARRPSGGSPAASNGKSGIRLFLLASGPVDEATERALTALS